MKYKITFTAIAAFLFFTSSAFSQEKSMGLGFRTGLYAGSLLNTTEKLSNFTFIHFEPDMPLSSIEFSWRPSSHLNVVAPLGYARVMSVNPEFYSDLFEAGVVGIYYFTPLVSNQLTPLVQLGLSLLGDHRFFQLPGKPATESTRLALRGDLAVGAEYLFSSNLALFATASVQLTYFMATLNSAGSVSGSWQENDRWALSTMVLFGARFYIW